MYSNVQQQQHLMLCMCLMCLCVVWSFPSLGEWVVVVVVVSRETKKQKHSAPS
jgi:hypothetical protein